MHFVEYFPLEVFPLSNQFDLQYLFSTTRTIKAMPSDISEISNWLVWGIGDVPCLSCDSATILICSSENAAFPSDVALFCLQEVAVTRVIDLPSNVRNVIEDRFKLAQYQSIELGSKAMMRLVGLIAPEAKPAEITEQVSLSVSRLTKTESEQPATKKSKSLAREIAAKSFSVLGISPADLLQSGADSVLVSTPELFVPVAEGFRNIAWIREYEARVIDYCYRNKVSHSLRNEAGVVIFTCNYFDNESAEFRKFRANCQAIRVRKKGDRTIGWIRQEEASAVLKAVANQADTDFSHIKAGNGGRVEFFPADSAIAEKYRSTTRLLRKD
jgi:hypothetical protein